MTIGNALDATAVLDGINAEVRPMLGEGRVARYIPALARVPIDQFGIALSGIGGDDAAAGDATTPFSIQSVSKLLGLTLALQAVGSALWERVGREPSGDPFNSLIQLEHEQGLPRNPFINAGAICVADQLVTSYGDPKQALLDLASRLCREPVAFDAEVARSERETGFRNAALVNFMKSFGRIRNDVDAVLDVYFHQCALVMNCRQMARAFGFLANEGVQPGSGEAIVTPRQARRINALMLTCGTYDAAGEFAFLIGLPCKSGVGGGIVAIAPRQLSLCVWSPGLDATGNSVAGRRALELFATRTGLSVF
ncbi:glutaminase [Piscinibacter sakaiensis]|uniref:glutaminase n=1 Tax=Piscinibacter sakaiensis TaxID=1547922 RepID=UPI003AAEA16F